MSSGVDTQRAVPRGSERPALPEVPLVSILTPSFNQAEWLADNLHSVACQTYPAIEQIVMDGGSTDATLEILEAADSSVRWRSEKDRGQSHAINKAFAESKGDIIGWINSDDAYFDCRVVEDVVAFFRRHPEVDVVYGHLAQIDPYGEIIWLNWVPPFSRRLLNIVNFIGQPVAFIRRVALTEPMLDESFNFSMDYELWLRLALRGAVFKRISRITAVDRHQPDRKTETIAHVMHGDIERLAGSHGRGYPRGKRLLSWGFYTWRRLMGGFLIFGMPKELAFTDTNTAKADLVRRQWFAWNKKWPADFESRPHGR